MAAGVVTWFVVTGVALSIARTDNPAFAAAYPWGALLAVIYLAAMWHAMRCERLQDWTARAALWLQLASAFGVGILVPVSFAPIYTIIWIAMASSYYSFTACWIFLAFTLAGWYGISHSLWQLPGAGLSVALYGTFHLFAMLSARTAREAEVARERAEALSRELVATQHLLSEASRHSERTRIARDLHDLLGHHLTALSLNLQVAERLAGGEVRAKVEQSRALARLLLADVREAVSALRDEGGVDFRRALGLLVETVPNLDIHLDIDPALEIRDVELAESLVRCVQEAITNTLRHAGAGRAWIRLWQEDGRIRLKVRDDGKVQGRIEEGNGFAGMRERLARVRGSLSLDTTREALELSVDIPMA